MTITDEAKQLRSEIMSLRPDKRRRYGLALRTRILNWVERVEAEGGSSLECSKFLGIRKWRFSMWRDLAIREGSGSEVIALVPVDTSVMTVSSSLVLITALGHRVEGLTYEQIVAALKELA